MQTLKNEVKSLIIAIVDDDELFHHTMRLSLEKLDSPKRLLFFNNGEEALQHFQKYLTDEKKLPDLVFLDIEMPVMNGFQFMERFKKLKKDYQKQTTVHMVTASMSREDINRTRHIHEISEYLLKPLKENDLKGLLEETLRPTA